MGNMSFLKLDDGTLIRMKNGKPMTEKGRKAWDKQERRKL